MQNIDFLISKELSHSPSHTRSKAFSLVCWCPTVFHQHTMFMYACLCHLKERVIVATFSVSKIGLYWQQLGKMKTDRTLFCPLAFVSRVVDVFFCGGVRMYVTQASSIFCAISFLFFPRRSHSHVRAHTPQTEACILKCWRLGVEMPRWGETLVRLRNLQLFVL